MQFEEQRKLFAYENLAFDVQEISSEERDGITIKDIRFTATANKTPVSAYLVQPDAEGKHCRRRPRFRPLRWA